MLPLPCARSWRHLHLCSCLGCAKRPMREPNEMRLLKRTAMPRRRRGRPSDGRPALLNFQNGAQPTRTPVHTAHTPALRIR